MEKLFLTSKEVADLLNISQQQAYKIIRDMNKQLAEHGFPILRGKINKNDSLNRELEITEKRQVKSTTTNLITVLSIPTFAKEERFYPVIYSSILTA